MTEEAKKILEEVVAVLKKNGYKTLARQVEKLVEQL